MTLEELSEAGQALQEEISNLSNYVVNPNTLGQELLGRVKNLGQDLLNRLNPFWRENLSYFVSEPPIITINGVKIENKKHFLSLKYTSKTNGYGKSNYFVGGEIEINLLDSDGELEYDIITGRTENKLFVPINIKFPNNYEITMQCSNVSSTYGPLSTLTFNGISLGMSDITVQNEARTFENMKISDIVKQIISENPDWVEGEIAETRPITENGLEHKSFTKNADTSYYNFMLGLAPLAVSTNGEIGNYQLDMYPNQNAKTEVHFRPINPKKEPTRIICFSFRDVNNAKSAQVIEYSPEMKNVITGMFIPKLDENGNIKPEPYEIPDGAKYEYITTKSEETNGFIMIKGDPETAYGQSKLSGLALANNLAGMTANITLWGYDINLRTNTNILILAQDGRGNIHYSSGYYLVREVTVQFENGKWTQELTVYRTGATIDRTINWIINGKPETNKTEKTEEKTDEKKMEDYNKRTEDGVK